MSDSPAVILYSNQGNPIGVVLDGTIYRLQVETAGKVPDGYAISGAANPILVAGTDGYTVQTLRTDAKGNTFSILTSPNSLDNQYATITPYGNLRVSQEPSTLLADKFDGDVLDPVRWSTDANLVPTGVSVNGNLEINTLTFSAGYSSVFSNFEFTQQANVFIQMGLQIQLEQNIQTNTHRFWGLGTPGDGTVNDPISDGIGYEIDKFGLLHAVIYSNNQKIFNYDLTAPQDGYYHRYSFQWRTDIAYFYGPDGPFEAPIAAANLKSPYRQKLPVRFHIINDTIPPSNDPIFRCSAIGLTDTGRNNISISDGEYQWQKLSIDSRGSIPLQESATDGSTAPERAVQIAARGTDNKIRFVEANTDGMQSLNVQDENSLGVLNKILSELKKIKFHLNQITDVNMDKDEDL